MKTVILVHGAFVDGSGWAAVHGVLKAAGHEVIVVQNPTSSLIEDVVVVRRAIAAAQNDVVLVGHSYGGVVITEAGTDPKVTALVYVAAFAPDAGESVAALFANAPPGAESPPIVPLADGFLVVDRAKFPQAFAADAPADITGFMADSQTPWGGAAFAGQVTVPAWKSKPSWFVVAANDRMIPPDAQRGMAARAGATVTETAGSHAFFISNPGPVADAVAAAAGA